MCLNKAIYANKGLVAIRYPRGSEDVAFNKSVISTEYLFVKEKPADTLMITYGRLYNEVYKAHGLLNADGINCDILKLTKIYPINRSIIAEIAEYKRIVFFEESMGEGSISEKFGDLLAEYGYSGDYSRITANGYIKQASVKQILSDLGMSCDKIADYIRKRSVMYGET